MPPLFLFEEFHHKGVLEYGGTANLLDIPKSNSLLQYSTAPSLHKRRLSNATCR